MAPKPRSSSRIALALLLVAGCATVPSREPIGEDAQRALTRLAERSSEFTDLRTLADIDLKQGEERQHLRGVLLVKAPASVRFEALSPLGQPLLLVTVHDGRLTAYDAGKNEASTGPANAETIAKALGLPLEPGDLVAVLAGRAVPPNDLRRAELVPADNAGPSLRLVGARARERVWLDLETGSVRQLEISGKFDVLIKYRRAATGALAGFDLDAARSYVTGSIAYQNPVENGGIDQERFELTIPKGAKIQTIR